MSSITEQDWYLRGIKMGEYSYVSQPADSDAIDLTSVMEIRRRYERNLEALRIFGTRL